MWEKWELGSLQHSTVVDSSTVGFAAVATAMVAAMALFVESLMSLQVLKWPLSLLVSHSSEASKPIRTELAASRFRKKEKNH